MENQTCENNCTYYIDKYKMPIYKYKFLWVIVIATIAIVILFLCVVWQYNKSLKEIIDIHSYYTENSMSTLPDVKLSKDTCYYLNERLLADCKMHMEEMENLLKLQSTKIQSDYTLLSVWAGILMIVFLIFSIYSMFKADEMVKQGREALRALEETKIQADDEVRRIDDVIQKEMDKVKDTASAEIKRLSNETQESIKQVKEEMNSSAQGFDKLVEGNVKNFETAYTSYLEKLQRAETNTTNLFAQMRKIFSEQAEMERTDQFSKSDNDGAR